MARKSASNSSKNPAEAKLGDIRTAAKSTMADADYSMGYPPRPGTLHNMNFSGKSKKGSK